MPETLRYHIGITRNPLRPLRGSSIIMTGRNIHRKFRSLTHLLGLRYRLLRAQARLSNGKFILYLTGCLLFGLAAVFLQFGGIGAVTAAIYSGKAELTTGILLSVIYANAILFALLLGIGLDPVFSDEVLRRYPLRRVERFAARQVLSILEPIWLLILMLYIGMALGFSLSGIASFRIAVPAAVLLAISNYLPARILSMLVDRLLAVKHGPQILLIVVMLLFMLPALLIRIDWESSTLQQNVLPSLQWFPPFAAAAVFTGKFSLLGLGWTLYLLICCFALAAAVFRLDHLPMPARSITDKQSLPLQTGDSFYDRVADYFPADIGPLVGKILRYYVRSPQLRFNYLFSLFGILPFTMLLGGREDAARSFSLAVGYISIVGYISMGAMTSNVFGFDNNGFRRYFLLPVSAKSVLKASAAVPLLLGIAVVIVSIALWLIITPASFEGRMLLVLLSSGFAGLLLFQALGIWVSLFNPRAIPFKISFGTRLSAGANALMIAAIFLLFLLPSIPDTIGMQKVLALWWIALVLLLGTAAFYIATLHTGAIAFSNRRERMLATIERGC